MNYFRITGYDPENDFSFIADSNGLFNELWEFSSFLVKKGVKIIAVNFLKDIIDINMKPCEVDKENILIRATQDGKPIFIEHTIDGKTYKAIKIKDKYYIPNKAV